MKRKKGGSKLPEWAPANADRKFASRIIEGERSAPATNSASLQGNRSRLAWTDVDKLVEGVLSSDRTLLSKAITLIESNSTQHFALAQELVKRLLPYAGKSVRIGITGVPGSGKSTFIETFGSWLISQGNKVAVLAIDPSSTISKGSILGDKTRMEKLSRLDNSYIRPSPSSGVLGGVARKTRETILTCEAAGYDVILVETVGVGQSEVTVRSIVDFFLLLQITGAGDELQGIKKGIMELADLIVINKADGDNKHKAETARAEIAHILNFIAPITSGWKTTAITCSGVEGINIDSIWKIITDFTEQTKVSGIFQQRRMDQQLEWLDSMLTDALLDLLHNDQEVQYTYRQLKQEILSGTNTPALAASILIELFRKNISPVKSGDG